jgi:rare lipoprotein A (peptidoglycan hydrolase)
MLLPGTGRYGVPTQRKIVPESIIANTRAISNAAHRMSDHALLTAKIVISAEEKLQQRVRSVLRVTVATIFFGISGLISLGANATAAFAKKVSPDRGKSSTSSVKRTAKGLIDHPRHLMSATHRHSAKHKHQIASNHHKTMHQIASSMRSGRISHGIASWYGKQFQHRKTASGIRFNTHAMMAAHKTLPFGTKVRVTNLATHKSCIVEITDRGPYAKHRVIDLSLAAAEKIDMTKTGTAPVEIEVLGVMEPTMYQDLATRHLKRHEPVFDGIPNFPARTLAGMLNATTLNEQSQ